MSRKQWIWLLVAVIVFAASGAVSIAMNTWAKTKTENAMGSSLSGLYDSALGTGGEMPLPNEPFIAKLDIEGTIVSSGSAAGVTATGFDEDYILDYIDRLTECDANRGILLYVNSGGGEMKASDDVYLKLMEYKDATGRPIYAYFDGTACSGAYYISMAADEIWANRNTICVNIGVYISTYNLKGLFDKYGVEEIMIRSSRNKGIGAIGQEWTEEQLAIYQSIVDLYYDQFLEVVSAGRNMPKETVMALDDGREMLAIQALQTGFIDGIGGYEEYKERLENSSDEELMLYEEELSDTDMLMRMLQNIYGKLETLVPRSDGEILKDFVDSRNDIVVMAYAG